MEISSNMPNINATVAQTSDSAKTNFTEKISKDEAIEIREQITQAANDMMFKSISIQSNMSDKVGKEGFSDFLSDIGYAGKPIAELSQDEAAELVSEDGFFGITQTSDRIANFVIDGSGGDEGLMRAGREGMLEGFKQAEEMWGGELPDISQKTMQAAIEKVDKAMHDFGFSIINTEV